MSHIAERAGIGRPTLYKYFPDVEAILLAWHQQHVEEQLDELIRIRDRADQPHWARTCTLAADSAVLTAVKKTTVV